MAEIKKAIALEDLNSVNGGRKKASDSVRGARNVIEAPASTTGEEEICPKCGKRTLHLYPSFGWECLNCGYRK